MFQKSDSSRKFALARAKIRKAEISHRIAEVEQVADKISFLRDGRTVGTSERGKMDRTGIVRLMLGKELTQTDVRPPEGPRSRCAVGTTSLPSGSSE
jgi:ribose transport system ATP-binding protein